MSITNPLPQGVVCPPLKPCPFCGKAPKVHVRMPGAGYLSAQSSIQCDGFGHRVYCGEIREVAEWVGNDKPLNRWLTDEQGAQQALDWAAKEWNTRKEPT